MTSNQRSQIYWQHRTPAAESTIAELVATGATCDWCQRQVISFVGPPHMATVAATFPVIGGQAWVVCGDCYTELIKWIAGRKFEPVKSNQDL